MTRTLKAGHAVAASGTAALEADDAAVDIAALLPERRAIDGRLSAVRKANSEKTTANRRDLARAKTREMVLTSAREIWAEPGSYERGDLRSIARHMGRSTGSVFAHFATKADLWRAAMGYEPPVDCAEVRELLRMASKGRIAE